MIRILINYSFNMNSMSKWYQNLTNPYKIDYLKVTLKLSKFK